jgi:hypothetical protein
VEIGLFSAGASAIAFGFASGAVVVYDGFSCWFSGYKTVGQSVPETRIRADTSTRHAPWIHGRSPLRLLLEHISGQQTEIGYKKYRTLKTVLGEHNIAVLFGDDTDYFEHFDAWTALEPSAANHRPCAVILRRDA